MLVNIFIRKHEKKIDILTHQKNTGKKICGELADVQCLAFTNNDLLIMCGGAISAFRKKRVINIYFSVYIP